MEEKKELRLEDFIAENDLTKGDLTLHGNPDPLFLKTVEDVRQVLSLAGTGNTIDEIVKATGLDRDYVYNIQVCAQGFREDDEIAVAHLVLG